MKKQKLQAGLYMYGDYRIEKEWMGDVEGMKSVRRWNVLKIDYGGWCVVHDAPSLKAAMTWVDRKESQKRSEKIMTKMIEDSPSIRHMFRDLGYITN